MYGAAMYPTVGLVKLRPGVLRFMTIPQQAQLNQYN